MDRIKTIAGNTLSQIVSRIISSGAGFFITLLVARSFGIGGYSDLAKITALGGLFYLGIDLGANAIFLQFEKDDQSIQQFFSFRLLMATTLFLAICLLTLILPYNTTATSGYSPFVKLGIILFSLSFFSRAVTFTAGAIFQQKLIYKSATWATLISSFATLGGIAFFVWLHLSLLWIVGVYVVGGCIESGVSLFFAKEKISFIIPSKKFFTKIFFATLPLTILLFLNLIYFRIDMILLTLFQKSHDVGIYDFAYKFFDFLIALPLFLSNSLYPLLLVREKNSRIPIKNISLYSGGFFLSGLLLIPLVWILSPLLGLVKQDFIPSILPLRLLALSLPVFFATNILQWIFITKKKQTFLVFVYAISLVVNVLLNVVFIPRYSYIASAILTGVSELFILLAMIIYLFFTKV